MILSTFNSNIYCIISRILIYIINIINIVFKTTRTKTISLFTLCINNVFYSKCNWVVWYTISKYLIHSIDEYKPILHMV